jgi:hypothetical protein
MEVPMRRPKMKRGRFRVGNWVTLLYGPRVVLAKVIEDRGPLGWRGRQIYAIQLDRRQDEEPTILEMPEDELTAATDDDVARWKSQRSLALHQTATYYEAEKDEYGEPKYLHHYLIVAKPGWEPGAATASIITLRKPRANGDLLSPTEAFSVTEGGPEAALAQAADYLDRQHPGLPKMQMPPWP